MQLAMSSVNPRPAEFSARQTASGELNETPATPTALFAIAAAVPATCVPCPWPSVHVPSRIVLIRPRNPLA